MLLLVLRTTAAAAASQADPLSEGIVPVVVFAPCCVSVRRRLCVAGDGSPHEDDEEVDDAGDSDVVSHSGSLSISDTQQLSLSLSLK